MSDSIYKIILCLTMLLLCFCITSVAAENSEWKTETNTLQEKINQSLGKVTSDEIWREELTVEEIREALVLSCEHTPSCTHDQLAAVRAGKQPEPYDEAQGLRNAQAIFRLKSMLKPRKLNEAVK
ncbi:MAG TPA: hypothetical protein ENJ32_11440 [Crenotrichaceae bacterium]|nr:hypothetical protein [Crenotrichaceae bacterium]